MPLQNIPSVMDLINDGSAIAELDLETVSLLLEDAKALSSAATRVRRALQEEVETRLKDQITAAYLAKGEDTGTVHVSAEGQHVEITRPKKVEWDQDTIVKTLERIKLAGDDPAEYVKTTHTVSEAAYNNWPSYIRAEFEPARTVKTGSVSIKIKGAEK